MKFVEAYRLRWRRKRQRFRALLKRRELKSHVDRTDAISSGDVLLFFTVRDDLIRLPYFFNYYRNLGVSHFLVVDNGSTDGTSEFLQSQPDASVWRTDASYKRSQYGVDWLNWLLRRHGHGHWCLTVDTDEFFVYPFFDTRPLPALADWLDASSVRSFGTMLLDMYPKGPISTHRYDPGQDPFETACWFDAGNYSIKPNWSMKNLWIQGGPRARHFFSDEPKRAPALNKIPFVKWDKRYTYTSSTHMLLPRGLNLVYDERGGEKTSGVLLHAKFLNVFPEKALEETQRGEHYASSVEYRAYLEGLGDDPDFWTKWSEKYINWRQLEILGLMSKGNWA